jgi:hypothetical protein
MGTIVTGECAGVIDEVLAVARASACFGLCHAPSRKKEKLHESGQLV